MAARSASASAGDRAGTRVTVFGLDVEADTRLRFLEPASTRPAGRRLALSVRPCERRDLDWPRSASVICSRRGADAREGFRIEAHAEAGYLIWGRDSGSYVLSVDGQRLDCAPLLTSQAQTWERFLVGQVLPFAALVSGLEIFHASGVVLERGAIALAGPSGTGKTTLALSLCEAGASFLADDVLALEVMRDGLHAHPGPPLAGVEPTAARRLRKTGTLVAGEALSVSPSEEVLRVRTSSARTPLRALFFLDRRPDGPAEPRFEPVTDSSRLLAATFNFVLATPARLRGLLDVCALVGRERVERIVVARSLDASQLARAIVRRLDAPT